MRVARVVVAAAAFVLVSLGVVVTGWWGAAVAVGVVGLVFAVVFDLEDPRGS